MVYKIDKPTKNTKFTNSTSYTSTGFTLIETFITIAIFIVIMGAVFGFVLWAYRTYGYTFQQSQAIREARAGVERMVKEIREARVGDDGSFIIEKADDYEFVFYSDIDGDKNVERVRYFIKPAGGGSGSNQDSCVSFTSGGSCSVSFSNFLSGALENAEVKVSAEGDLNSSWEKIDIYADGVKLGTLCKRGCGQCSGTFQDLTSFNVSNQASDNSIEFTADASNYVNPFCDWKKENHSFIVNFEFSWREKPGEAEKAIFKKGVIEPSGWPIKYPSSNEEFFIISENIQNEARREPVFTYYDSKNNVLSPNQRMEKTTLMKLRLIINVDPKKPPNDFLLESKTQIRNLKTNL